MLSAGFVALPFVAFLSWANDSAVTLETSLPTTPTKPPWPAGRWSSTVWAKCSNACGSGTQSREVSCVLEDVSGTLLVVGDRFCDPHRPQELRECFSQQPECANSWEVGEWSKCSAKCGGGHRSRGVECRKGTSRQLLPPQHCVEESRPAASRPCNQHPCPDGRRAWLETSDHSPPFVVRLHSKFTLRCPFPVYWTPADDRTKRKYAWFKDGLRLPAHTDKYTMADSRGELRVKGADLPDAGVYTCASLTGNPPGKAHNITVRLWLTEDSVRDSEQESTDQVEESGGLSTTGTPLVQTTSDGTSIEGGTITVDLEYTSVDSEGNIDSTKFERSTAETAISQSEEHVEPSESSVPRADKRIRRSSAGWPPSVFIDVLRHY